MSIRPEDRARSVEFMKGIQRKMVQKSGAPKNMPAVSFHRPIKNQTPVSLATYRTALSEKLELMKAAVRASIRPNEAAIAKAFGDLFHAWTESVDIRTKSAQPSNGWSARLVRSAADLTKLVGLAQSPGDPKILDAVATFLSELDEARRQANLPPLDRESEPSAPSAPPIHSSSFPLVSGESDKPDPYVYFSRSAKSVVAQGEATIALIKNIREKSVRRSWPEDIAKSARDKVSSGRTKKPRLFDV